MTDELVPELAPELLARILEVMPVGIQAKDPHQDLRYVLWNEAMAAMTGMSAEDVLGRTDAEVFPPEIARIHNDDDLEVWRNGRMIRRDGEISQFSVPGHVVNVSKLPLRGADGEVALVLTLVEDVSEKRRLERHVLQAQKMEAVGRLAGGIAHDFNNLLQVIMGYGEMLRADLPDGNNRDDLGRMLKAGRQAVGLVNQLLSFSRQDRARTEPVNLEKLIDRLYEVLRRVLGEEVELVWQPAGQLPPVLADTEQIEKVLLDLCVNARNAMPGGGTITMSTSHGELDESWCLRHPGLVPGYYVSFTVSDTGLGIPPELQTTIFEPFFTTKDVGDGNGLGLAAVYAVARAHRGAVEVESQPGHGASFTVWLPVAADEIPEPEKEVAVGADAGSPVDGRGQLVLVAEDQEEVRELCASILERAGYRVLQACDGVEAVKVFQACNERVDLLLLDVVMPRLNGRGAYESIVAGGVSIPVIFCSGYHDDVLARDYLVDTPGELLQKPYHPNELLARVAGACGRKTKGEAEG